MDLCGDSSPGVGPGKSGLTPGKILPAGKISFLFRMARMGWTEDLNFGCVYSGIAIAGLSAIASRGRRSSDRQSGEYWSTSGEGSPAVWESGLGGIARAADDSCGWSGGHSVDMGSGNGGGVCDV